ncbi:MAG: alginate export family protein [Planctomycetes bacterium]|nr:alginate export family protein [Planctomycetota bacterium]
MIPRFVPVALAAFLSVPLIAQSTPSTRPPRSLLRQDEDWSRFRADPDSADPFDTVKHIALAPEGGTWLSLGGQVDTRFESWDGFGFGATTPGNRDAFLLARALAHIDFRLDEHFRVWVEGKSAHSTHRDLPGLHRTSDVDTLDLHQGFVDYVTGPTHNRLRVRAGRQSFVLGAQRVVTVSPWGNTMNTFDGFSAELETEHWTLLGLATWFVPVRRYDFNQLDEHRALYGVYATLRPEPGGRGLDLYALGNTRPNVSVAGTTGDEDRFTFGFRSFGPLGRLVGGVFDGELEAAYQTGEVGSHPVDAWFSAGVLGFRPEGVAWAPRVFTGFDAASGDHRPGGSVQTYHQLFALGHAYFGWADVFGRQNILSAHLGLELHPSASTTLIVTGHTFRPERRSDVLYGTGGTPLPGVGGARDWDLGQELDLIVRQKLGTHVDAYLGYSHFFAGPGIARTGGGVEDIDFAYAGASFAF